MIIVKVELKSALGEDRDRKLGEAKIFNLATGTRTMANYEVELRSGKSPNPKFKGKVFGFRRTRRNHWDLLFLSLASALGHDRVLALLAESRPEMTKNSRETGKTTQHPTPDPKPPINDRHDHEPDV